MRRLNFFYIFFIALTFTSCDAIFEDDISADMVDAIIPTNEDTLYTNKVHFKWNELHGATFYNLRIVKPSFDNIETYVLDSNIRYEEFYQILNPGNYEYQIRGENSGYQTNYTAPRSFYVDSVIDLSDQAVLIISPVDNQFINGESAVTMTWQNLFSADQYDYVLKSGASFESGSVLDQVIGQVTLSRTIDSDFFATEGTYYCGVRGVNVSGSTDYSYRTIFVDKTTPNIPDLVSPVDLATIPVEDPVVFKWNNGTDPGTIHSDVMTVVEISTSETFIDYITIDDIDTDSLSYSFTESGNYWWRVYAKDAVGHESDYSSERQITIE